MKKSIKIIFSIMIIILLCGCDAEDIDYDIYKDKETCVLYLSRIRGGVTPMYNQDGTLKLDKKCLESNGDE